MRLLANFGCKQPSTIPFGHQASTFHFQAGRTTLTPGDLQNIVKHNGCICTSETDGLLDVYLPATNGGNLLGRLPSETANKLRSLN